MSSSRARGLTEAAVSPTANTKLPCTRRQCNPKRSTNSTTARRCQSRGTLRIDRGIQIRVFATKKNIQQTNKLPGRQKESWYSSLERVPR